jgi:hypothetical protein
VTLVTLDLHEIEMAAQVGLRRRMESLRDGRKDQHGFDGACPFEVDIQAAAAECAFAKLRNRYWDGSFNTMKRGDVGDVQVRWSRDKPCLIIRPSDDLDSFFVFVTGEIPTFDVHGWAKAKTVAVDDHWRMPNGRPGAWFVPKDMLAPFPS